MTLLACGESGERPSRPIEVIYYVSGVSGTKFQVKGPEGEGFQAANANHPLGDREFESPMFFVMENAFEPVSAVFRVPEDQLNPITVSLLLGNVLRKTTEIRPGSSATVSEGTPDPVVTGPDVRFEVTSAAGPKHVGFDVTIGDLYASNYTNCNIRQVAAELCSTPAIFFLEDARDQVTGIFAKFSGQDPDAALQADLFLNGTLAQSSSGTGTIIIDEDL